MTRQYTRWFKSTDLPTRPGAYQVDQLSTNPPFYRKFDGKWYLGDWTPAAAMSSDMKVPERLMDFKWRGLTQEPAVT